MRLLVVEDEPDLADVVARGMRRDGHAVDVAETVADAEFKLRSAAYDLVILDWNLPDGSGLALCRALVDGSLPTLDGERPRVLDRRSTRLNSSHVKISYAVFCLKKKKNTR